MAKTKVNNEKFVEDLVKSVYEDFESRREERLNFERQWKLKREQYALQKQQKP